MNNLLTALTVLLFFCMLSLSLTHSLHHNKTGSVNACNRNYDETTTSLLKYYDDGCWEDDRDVLATSRSLSGANLIFVTPWNRNGYDYVRRGRRGFTHVSPVWFQLHRTISSDNAITYSIAGDHDIDELWIGDLRQPAEWAMPADEEEDVSITPPLIVPRVIVEGFSGEDWSAALSHEQEEFSRAIVDLVLRYDFDGIVLETWLQLSGVINRIRDHLHRLLLLLARRLREVGKVLILVVPPFRDGNRNSFISSDMVVLADAIEGFVLMTYDYSSPDLPGPNAPLKWMRQNIISLLPVNGPRRAKLWLGMNMYGYSFVDAVNGKKANMEVVLGRDMISMLSAPSLPQFQWDRISKEHYFHYTNEDGVMRKVYYPTMRSLNARLKLARKLGVGTSLWEGGQALPCFYCLYISCEASEGTAHRVEL